MAYLSQVEAILDGSFKGSALPMTEQQIRFDDGASYERMMGAWSRLAGDVFLDWLKPGSGLRWVDVGCGNGAFSELVVRRFAPAALQGVDPSEAQLNYARTRPGARTADFQLGDAMALPFPNDSFDVAVMALVIFFVPDPAKGVAEMVRVVRPGGEVAAYVWDIIGGKGAAAPIESEMRAMGLTPPRPPSFEASRIEALRELWSDAGLDAIETREIVVQRTFNDFDDFWTTTLLIPTLGPTFAMMPPKGAELLKTRVRARLPADAAGRITCEARANAVKGRIPE
jgi:ubiquinone/menaquinone biosynthesis C-methylase UbiE